MPQPNTYLIRVLVTINADGSTSYAIRELYFGLNLGGNGRNATLGVNGGDRVGWFVQRDIGGARKNLPYNVAFSNSHVADASFFGVSSLNLSNGGLSQFLTVHPLMGQTEYTLTIPGVLTIDPIIQSGGDGGVGTGIRRLVSAAYTVSWDTSNPNNQMTYSGGGANNKPISQLAVKDGDQVTFRAQNTGGAQITNFNIQFANVGLGWPSPFDQNNVCLPPCPPCPDGQACAPCPPCPGENAPSLGPFQVADPYDSGSQFPFVASITLDGQAVASNPNNPSPVNSIQMA